MTLLDDLAPTGVLRAAINLGNPVLAAGDATDPRGVTVDLAREIAARWDLGLELVCSHAARDSVAALVEDRADVGFVAVDPTRGDVLAFTDPYAVIEAVYVVPDGSPLRAAADVDVPGVRVGVKEGSAYDLFLGRELQQAEVVRGAEGTTVLTEQGLEAGAGIRVPTEELAEERGDLRVLEPAFMQIRQAVATSAARPAGVVAWLADLVEELKASGFVADALHRAGRRDAVVAPPRRVAD